MKKLFNDNKIYFTFVIISAIIYIWMIFFGGIGPINLSNILICNIILAGIIILFNLIFAVISKTNKFKWLICAIFIILFIFVPIKQQYACEQTSAHTWELYSYKKENLLNIITKDNSLNQIQEKKDTNTQTIVNDATLDDD